MVKELAHEAAEPDSFSWRFKDDKRQQLLLAKRREAADRTAERAA
jgi:NADH dehydrogenase